MFQVWSTKEINETFKATPLRVSPWSLVVMMSKKGFFCFVFFLLNWAKQERENKLQRLSISKKYHREPASNHKIPTLHYHCFQASTGWGEGLGRKGLDGLISHSLLCVLRTL